MPGTASCNIARPMFFKPPRNKAITTSSETDIHANRNETPYTPVSEAI